MFRVLKSIGGGIAAASHEPVITQLASSLSSSSGFSCPVVVVVLSSRSSSSQSNVVVGNKGCRYLSSSSSSTGFTTVSSSSWTGIVGGRRAPSALLAPRPVPGERRGLVSSLVPVGASAFFEQSRWYWGNEGRIGWRRRRSKGMQHREQILDPKSPVVDKWYPWPKDDTESLPPDLFHKEEEADLKEELRMQNAVLEQINAQTQNHTEGRLFAVVHINAKQFKVTPEDIIVVQNEFHPTTGDQIRLNKVLLVGGKDFTLVGRPILDEGLVRVEATVIEKTFSYTKINFKMWKRHNLRKFKFSKTPFTMLRINLIEVMQPFSMIKSEAETLGLDQQQSSTNL